jgi:hypothetical protein
MKVAGLIEQLLDSMDSGAIDRVVELLNLAGEGSTVGGGCVEPLSAGLLVPLDVVEAMLGVGFVTLRVDEFLARGVDCVVASCDGSVVASGPPPVGVLFEFGVRGVETPLGGCPVAGGGDEFVAGGAVVVAAVGRDARVERGELVVEMSSCDA